MMAKSTVDLEINVSANVFSLCTVQCSNFSCVYKDKESTNCSLKHISINTNGECENYRTVNMMV